MVFPTLVERHVGDDQSGFDRALLDSQRYIAAGMLLPAAAGGGAAAGVMALFGPGFSSASTALALVLLVPAISTMTNIQSDALLAVGRPLATTALAGARMAATIPLTIVLDHSMGATGAALGVTLGACVQLAVQFGVLRAHLSQPMLQLWPARQLAGLVAAYAGGFAVARLVDSVLPGVARPDSPRSPSAPPPTPFFLLIVGGLLPRDRARVEAIVDRRRARLEVGGSNHPQTSAVDLSVRDGRALAHSPADFGRDHRLQPRATAGESPAKHCLAATKGAGRGDRRRRRLNRRFRGGRRGRWRSGDSA